VCLFFQLYDREEGEAVDFTLDRTGPDASTVTVDHLMGSPPGSGRRLRYLPSALAETMSTFDLCLIGPNLLAVQ
jgi:hypothetical protein